MDSNTPDVESLSIFFGNGPWLLSDQDLEEVNNNGIRVWKFVSLSSAISTLKKLKTEISRIRFAEAVNSWNNVETWL